MQRNRFRILIALALVLCFPAVRSHAQTSDNTAQSFSYVSIDVPNAAATWASGIGPGGQIVGGYLDADGTEHGYLYRNGTFTTIDVPGSLVGVGGTLETEVNGINPAGDMVGDYFAPPGTPGAPACVAAFSPPCDRGFLYRHGQFYSILVTDHQGVAHLGSVPTSITPDGSIYGCLHDQTFGPQMFGFVRAHSDVKTLEAGGGEFMTLQAGGGEMADSTRSVSPSMNNGATPDASIIVGQYTPPGAKRAHGYTVQNGVLNDYLFPNSLATQIWGINPNGDFVGFFLDAAGFHGFLQPADRSAAPVPVDFVDPVTKAKAVQTRAFGINPAGAIVGFYLDSSSGEHAFLAVQTKN